MDPVGWKKRGRKVEAPKSFHTHLTIISDNNPGTVR